MVRVRVIVVRTRVSVSLGLGVRVALALTLTLTLRLSELNRQLQKDKELGQQYLVKVILFRFVTVVHFFFVVPFFNGHTFLS